MTETGSSPARRALDGVRVMALETSLSGPHATKILADMGAEVIKVERPGTGDVIRGWDTAVRGLSSGIVWITPNKKSFAINVKEPEAREILQRLAGKCDVVLENFAPGAAARSVAAADVSAQDWLVPGPAARSVAAAEVSAQD